MAAQLPRALSPPCSGPAPGRLPAGRKPERPLPALCPASGRGLPGLSGSIRLYQLIKRILNIYKQNKSK